MLVVREHIEQVLWHTRVDELLVRLIYRVQAGAVIVDPRLGWEAGAARGWLP